MKKKEPKDMTHKEFCEYRRKQKERKANWDALEAIVFFGTILFLLTADFGIKIKGKGRKYEQNN